MRTKDQAASFLSAALQLGAEGEFSRAVETVMLDAYKKGMTDAAGIAAQKSAVMPHYNDIARGYGQGRSEASTAIEDARDETESIP